MVQNFICPKCKGSICVGGHVIFSTKTKTGKTGLLLLSPTLGDYQIVHHETFKYEEGDILEFFCPICHEELTSEVENVLVEILLLYNDNQEHRILFSKSLGQRFTYEIVGGKVKAFGDYSDQANKLL